MSTPHTRGLMARYQTLGVPRPARHVIASLVSDGRTLNTHELEPAEVKLVLDLLAAEPDEPGAF